MTVASQQILGIGFNLIDYTSALQTILGWRGDSRSRSVAVVNPHSVILCREDSDMRAAVRSATLVLPDGVGIILAANILGYRHCGRVTGPTLLLRVCDEGRAYGLRHFLYGGAPGVAERLAARLSDNYSDIEIAGSLCPPFRTLSSEEDAEVVRQINDAKPDIVWVGLGAPKQERWMADHAGRVNAAALIGVGAAFDFHAGVIPWCPALLRRCGLEWTYRLAREPGRMWRRNVNSLVFLALVLGQFVRSKVGDRKAVDRTLSAH